MRVSERHMRGKFRAGALILPEANVKGTFTLSTPFCNYLATSCIYIIHQAAPVQNLPLVKTALTKNLCCSVLYIAGFAVRHNFPYPSDAPQTAPPISFGLCSSLKQNGPARKKASPQPTYLSFTHTANRIA